MTRAVIFDFNRTLFDPDINVLVKGWELVLQELSQNFELFLISRAGTERQTLIEKLEISTHFKRVIAMEEKTLEQFKELVSDFHISPVDSYVVGDYMPQEIAFGNQLGFVTIRIKAGKFAGDVPKSNFEQADFEVLALGDVLSVIHK